MLIRRKGRCGVFAGNSVWSTSTRLVVEVLTIGAIHVHFPFLFNCTMQSIMRNSTSRPMSRPITIYALLRRHRLLCHAPVFQPSAIELFRSPLPDCGTLCPYRMSRWHRHWLFLGNAWRSISPIVRLPKSPGVPAHWLCHFGHYNQSSYLLT